METASSPREQLLRKILNWAGACPEIQALVLVGSSAREDLPADEWSDLDLILVVEDPAVYLAATGWFAAIAEPWIGTVERGPEGGIVERRVLFRSGIDADFIVIARRDSGAFQSEPLRSITARGAKVLLDKGGFLPDLPPADPPAALPTPPSAEEFLELVNDFWFHAVWTAKKIRRGELWTAKSCCDVYMKRHLLKMIEWQARLSGAETWYNGRFIERWARADVREQLGSVFAHYAAADVWRALEATMDLFARLSRETAVRCGFLLPEETVEGIRGWVLKLREYSGCERPEYSR